MKNKITSRLLILAFGFTINSCSTPEERATVIQQSDSTHTHAQTMKGKTPNDSTSKKSDSSTNTTNRDTSKNTSNQKVSTYKHTPIDTVTRKSDSLKH